MQIKVRVHQHIYLNATLLFYKYNSQVIGKCLPKILLLIVKRMCDTHSFFSPHREKKQKNPSVHT